MFLGDSNILNCQLKNIQQENCGIKKRTMRKVKRKAKALKNINEG